MYRYGIIGFGGLGKIHLSNLIKLQQKRGDFKLAAICGTTREEATKTVAVNFGTADVSSVDFSSCNFYQDYKEMIDTENQTKETPPNKGGAGNILNFKIRFNGFFKKVS